MGFLSNIVKIAGNIAPGPIGKAISGWIENDEQNKNAENQYQRQKADNLEQWNLVNAYNTPQNQMQRYKDAGLNPHMVATSGTSGNANSINQSQAPQQQTQDLSPISESSNPANVMSMMSGGLQMQGQRVSNDLTAQKYISQKTQNANDLLDLNDRQQARSKKVNGIPSYTNRWEQKSRQRELQNEIMQLNKDFTESTQDDRISSQKSQTQIDKIKAIMARTSGTTLESNATPYQIQSFLSKNNATAASLAQKFGLPKSIASAIIAIFKKGK
jgi:hypothetical protein